MRQLWASSRRFYSDYQHLQRSALPMGHFQASLPRLPVPPLSATCHRYVEALRPLLSAEALQHTQRLVADFQAGPGAALDRALRAKDAANRHTSFISEPWFDMYLSDRSPLPVNYTPLLGMRHTRQPPRPLATEVANIVVTTARFMKALRAQLLAPEVFFMSPKTAESALYRAAVRLTPNRFATYAAYAFKAFPLDMSQYQGLFSATRIPAEGRDRIWRATKDPQHVMVMRGGNIYRLDIMDRDGNIVEADVVLARVKRLLQVSNEAQQHEVSHPLGVLTAQNRDTWAGVRGHLESLSELNRRNLSVIDSAIFCLCLDDIDYEADDVVRRVGDCLFGNSANRWYDKSFSVIVSRDSRSSVTFEHSWGDGVAVLRYFNELFKELTQRPMVGEEGGAEGGGDDFLELLEFDVDDRVRRSIEDGAKRHKMVENSLNIDYMMAPIDKGMCKRARVSPDSVAQLTIQLAYALVTGGCTAATYESCSTAAFRCGRTETVRPATTATATLCRAIMADKMAASELVALLTDCSQRHNQLTKEAAMGQGFDRHLFAMRKMADSEVALFQDGAYKLINHNILSTSTLASPALEIGGFGPVVPDGYGIGYTIDADKLGMIVTTYKATRSGREFVQALQAAAGKIKDILQVAVKQ